MIWALKCRYTVLGMDGTFKAKPEKFKQLYVVFGSRGDSSSKIYPCAYVLLPNKDAATYSHMLTVLAKEVGSKPSKVCIDFEQAAIKAVYNIFGPKTSVRGCRFHRKKNLFDQVKHKKCANLFYNSESFQVGLDLVYNLDMVPPSDVRQ